MSPFRYQTMQKSLVTLIIDAVCFQEALSFINTLSVVDFYINER